MYRESRTTEWRKRKRLVEAAINKCLNIRRPLVENATIPNSKRQRFNSEHAALSGRLCTSGEAGLGTSQSQVDLFAGNTQEDISVATFNLLVKMNNTLMKQTHTLNNLQDAIGRIETRLDFLERAGGMPVAVRPNARVNILEAFPLRTPSELDETETKLGSKEYREQLLQTLRGIGGKNANDMCNNILRRIIADSLGQLFNWTGSKNKLPLKNLQLVGVITDCVRSVFPTATEADIKSRIVAHLKHASSRNAKATGQIHEAVMPQEQEEQREQEEEYLHEPELAEHRQPEEQQVVAVIHQEYDASWDEVEEEVLKIEDSPEHQAWE